MLSSTCACEDVLRGVGFGPVTGTDEVGHGAYTDSPVAAAVILNPARSVEGFDGPKALDPKRRVGLCERITERAVAVAWTRVEPTDCDMLGMHEADLQGLRRAVARLQVRSGFILTDGFPVSGLGTSGLGIWKGDKAVTCISAVSIVAKVQHGVIIAAYEQECPGYSPAVHRGYYTTTHKKALERLGPSLIHRLSYARVSDMVRV